MVQNDRIVLDAATRGDLPVQEQQRLIGLIDRFFPNKAGMLRRVHRIWGDNLRINYHDIYNEHKISESHFVTVGDQGDKLVEMN